MSGDEFKIEEVVTNYTSNALNHLNGEKEIEIRVLPEDDRVRVTVFNKDLDPGGGYSETVEQILQGR